MKVWVVFYGNYYPRELAAVYAHEADAREHVANSDQDLDMESLEVQETAPEGGA